jgi:hypothetical protein
MGGTRVSSLPVEITWALRLIGSTGLFSSATSELLQLLSPVPMLHCPSIT